MRDGNTPFTEKVLSRFVSQKLKTEFPELLVRENQLLIYKLFKNSSGDIYPIDGKAEKNNYAFDIDILISRHEIPLVAIELKKAEPTTHDVLVSSAKAAKHKEVYPYLRYGLIYSGASKLMRRFFLHNAGLDFACVIEDPEAIEMGMIDCVRLQTEIAVQMADVIEKNSENTYRIFQTVVKFS